MPQEADPIILLEFSMTPIGKGVSVSRFVARSLDIIDRCGLQYQLNPMGTILEGPWSRVMDTVRACLDRMREDCERITCSLKIDYRRGAAGRLVSKVESVEKKVGRPLKTSLS